MSQIGQVPPVSLEIESRVSKVGGWSQTRTGKRETHALWGIATRISEVTWNQNVPRQVTDVSDRTPWSSATASVAPSYRLRLSGRAG